MNAAERFRWMSLVERVSPWLSRANLTLVGAILIGAWGYTSGKAKGVATEHAATAKVLLHAIDSTAKVNAPKLARADTLVVRDTVTVRRTIARLDTLRDTVLTRLTDTVYMTAFVAQSDRVVHACTELANDCADFRRYAKQRFATDSQTIALMPSLYPKPSRFGIKTGIAIGFVAALALVHFTK